MVRLDDPSNRASAEISTMTVHHVKEEDVTKLEEIFAYLTPEGWQVPDWLTLMRATMQDEGEKQ